MDSFVFNDVSDQKVKANDLLMIRHSDNPIDRIIYVAEANQYEQYCASSGGTLYSGSSDQEITFTSKITQLRSFTVADGKPMIAAGLQDSSQMIVILDYETLSRQFNITNNGLYHNVQDFMILDQLPQPIDDDSYCSADTLSSNECKSVLILSKETLIIFNLNL